MLAKVTAGVLGTAALAGAYVVHEGAVRVRVDERALKGKKETHLHLLVPAALVPVGLECVPDGKLREAAERARPWLPAIRAAVRELARLPDAELVEVLDANEHVRIAKRSALFLLDVESARETVHISFPLKTVDQVARRLESLGPGS
jgi:hypothetical protein